MIHIPFQNLRQFDRFLDLRFFTRVDDIGSDVDIAKAIGQENVVGLIQEHGSRAHVVRVASSRVLRGDALFTDTPGLTLTIRFADCQNAVIVAPKRRVVGLVHAGWRGVQSRVMSSAFRLLKEEWGIQPEDVFIGLGPSLCTACAEFTDPGREVPELHEFFQDRCIDLRAALDAELADIGVPTENIERLTDCTRCHPETYFTYRGGDRDLVKNGKVNCLAVTLR